MTAAAAAAGSASFHWVKIECETACDDALSQVGKRFATTGSNVLGLLTRLQTEAIKGRLGPALLPVLAEFSGLAEAAVVGLLEQLAALGRVARSVLTAMTHRLSDPETVRARWRRAQQRCRQKQRQDRRQLSLLLPIGHRPVIAAAGDDTDDTRGAAMTEIEQNQCPTPRGGAMTGDDTPPEPPTEQSRETVDSFEPKKEEDGVSRRCAPSPSPPAAPDNSKTRRRANLLKTLGRWARHSPAVAEEERLGHLELLARAELALNDWWGGRPVADQRALDALAARAKQAPLPPDLVRAIYETETGRGPNFGFQAMLARAGWFHGDPRGGRAA